jgi:hypothetical protein
MMRQSLFAGRRLRASYHNVPMDSILALLEGVDEPDEDYSDSYCLHRPLRRLRNNEEEQ